MTIYFEAFPLKHAHNSRRELNKAKKRNNYKPIFKQENERQLAFQKNVDYYHKMFVEQPVLKVQIKGGYSQTYNMYGTLALDGVGTVFSGFTGVDTEGDNFGNFKIIDGKNTLGGWRCLKTFRK